jgi:hypothetical protein
MAITVEAPALWWRPDCVRSWSEVATMPFAETCERRHRLGRGASACSALMSTSHARTSPSRPAVAVAEESRKLRSSV